MPTTASGRVHNTPHAGATAFRPRPSASVLTRSEPPSSEAQPVQPEAEDTQRERDPRERARPPLLPAQCRDPSGEVQGRCRGGTHLLQLLEHEVRIPRGAEAQLGAEARVDVPVEISGHRHKSAEETEVDLAE